MNEDKDLVLEEYKISKESIRSIMSQLSAVTTALLAVSIAMLQFSSNQQQSGIELLLWYMVLLLINFVAAYTVYQNVQITALQRHIAYLEKKLGDQDVFRWESVIARIWYEGKGLSSRVLNVLVLIPPLAILAAIYAGVAIKAGLYQPLFYVAIGTNMAYLAALAIVFRQAKAEIERVNLPLLRGDTSNFLATDDMLRSGHAQHGAPSPHQPGA